MTGKRVLVVDDDPQILRVMRTCLRAQELEVVTAPNGESALVELETTTLDLVILDLGLPGMGGIEVIERLRTWSDVPVIVLSVREEYTQKVSALDAGADDYLTKPFVIEELLARLRAVMRRSVVDVAPADLHFGELELDLNRKLVLRSGERVHLTPKEWGLLEAMATNPGKLLTHRWLLQRVWGAAYVNESHYLRVLVQQLRQKLGDDARRHRWIATEPGLGYRWDPTSTSPADSGSRETGVFRSTRTG
jgi:two-component system KDP operon response regulator KdpE